MRKFWIAILFYIAASLTYALMAVVKHLHFETLGDLAVFNQGIWQYSQFKWPFISLHLNRPFLSDHFHPILLTLVPFYWILKNEVGLLIMQPLIILSGIFPLYLLTMRKIKSIFFAFCLIIAYTFYLPVQYTIFYDFHEIIFAPPLIIWAYYFLKTGRKRFVFLCLLLLLLVKEEMGFLVSAFGFYLAVFERGWKKFGLFWMAMGFIYTMAVIYFVIPKIGGSYYYFGYGEAGRTLVDVFKNIFSDPYLFVRLMFNEKLKIETIIKTFFPFSFLPIFSPIGLVLSFEQFFTRFVDSQNMMRWSILYHYSAPMAGIMVIGTVWVVERLKKRMVWGFGVLILILTIVSQIHYSSVTSILKKQFWETPSYAVSINKAIKMLPKDATVVTQINIAPHISNRKKLYYLHLFDDYESVDYVLVDFHEGQSVYHFENEEIMTKKEAEVGELLKSGKFELVFSEGEVKLLKNRLNSM